MPGTSSAGGRWDHEVTKGGRWSVSCTLLSSREPDVPRNITSGLFTITVKSAEDSSGSALAVPSGAIVSGAAGTFTVSMTLAEVNALTAGSYWWSGTFTPSGGEAEALWHGKFVVRDVVTP